MARGRLLLAGLSAAALAVGLSGCQSNVKGSWVCAMDPGSVCASVAEIDHMPAHRSDAKPAKDPVIDGAVPARLFSQGGWTAGAIAGAPIREPDPVVKVAIAPWIDDAGDYHAGSEIYGVMRKGSWYVVPKSVTQRVDLSRMERPAAAQPTSAQAGAQDAAMTAPSGAAPTASKP